MSFLRPVSSTTCTDAPLWKSPQAGTHRDFQGPGEADGGHAAPALGWEGDHVVLMDSILPVRQQQALRLWVLEGARRKEKEEAVNASGEGRPGFLMAKGFLRVSGHLGEHSHHSHCLESSASPCL